MKARSMRCETPARATKQLDLFIQDSPGTAMAVHQGLGPRRAAGDGELRMRRSGCPSTVRDTAHRQADRVAHGKVAATAGPAIQRSRGNRKLGTA